MRFFRGQLSPSSEEDSALPARIWQAAKFGLVGASGMVVNTIALAFATEALGIHYLASVALATQASTVWNYSLIDGLVFQRQGTIHGTSRRFARYWLLNMSALIGRFPIIWLLTSVLGVHYVISNLLTLVLLFIVRFFVSDRWIWAARPDAGGEAPSAAAGGPVAERS